jgi:hypothetical protein
LGIVRSISYGLFGKPDRFVPQLRELGATLVRVYFYRSWIEPEPGRTPPRVASYQSRSTAMAARGQALLHLVSRGVVFWQISGNPSVGQPRTYHRSQWTMVSRGARAAGRKSVPMV